MDRKARIVFTDTRLKRHGRYVLVVVDRVVIEDVNVRIEWEKIHHHVGDGSEEAWLFSKKEQREQKGAKTEYAKTYEAFQIGHEELSRNGKDGLGYNCISHC